VTRCLTRGAARGESVRAIRMLSFGSVLAALMSAEPAHSAAGEWQAGGRLGVAWLAGPRWGPELEGYVRRGIGDAFDVDLQFLTSLHPFQSDSNSLAPRSAEQGSDTAWAIGIAPGILYRWDVFRLVPYLGAGLGVFKWHGADRELGGTQLGVSGRLGLDYLLNRSVVLSVQASAHLVDVDGTVRVPWVQFGFGAAHAWGW
jgi:hypothetical protein